MMLTSCMTSRYNSGVNVSQIDELAFIQPRAYQLFFSTNTSSRVESLSEASEDLMEDLITSYRYPFSDMVAADYAGKDKDIARWIDGFSDLEVSDAKNLRVPKGLHDKIVAFPTTYVWKMANFGKVEIWGIDVTMATEIPLTRNVSALLTGNFTQQRAKDKTNPKSQTYNNDVPYTPRSHGNLSIILNNPWVNVGYSLCYCGSRYSMGQNKPEYRIRQYTESSLTLSRDFQLGASRLKLAASVDYAGADLTYVTADVLDRKGTLVPDAAQELSFTVKGPAEILATDAGDATSHVPFYSHTLPAFHGKASAILRRTGEGPVTVTVKARGLHSATLQF